jgi:hypothetical protein
LLIDGLAGVTAMDCNVGAVIVSTVDPVMAPEVALMVDVPVATPLANPPAVIVATDGVAELQVAVLVRFCVEPSLYFPVAVNCCVAPLEIDGFAGVIAMDCNVGAVTVSNVEPVTEPDVALTIEVPVATPLANPPAVIVATDGVAELQVAVLVRFCVELSL